MKPYKGLVRINCTSKKCPQQIKNSVAPECIACPVARVEVVDLEGKVVFEHSGAPKVPAKKKTRKK